MSSISEYFKNLRDWKLLPAYRAEPRVDSIVGFALPQILEHARNLKVTTVIPELPLRIGSVLPKYEGTKFCNKSYKVDFFVVTECGRNILIEFKTDSGSRREKQDKYLVAAKTAGLNAVVSGVLRLFSKTTYKKKYRHLLAKLGECGLIEDLGSDFTPTVSTDELSILYVQPHEKDGDEGRDILDFETVAGALDAKFGGDEFMQTAAKTLRCWAKD